MHSENSVGTAGSVFLGSGIKTSLPPALLAVVLAIVPLFSAAQTAVSTYHADTARGGAISSETLLTPANVNSKEFGKLFSYSVDGFVVGQPLYVSNVQIPGSGVHNVVYVATAHDSVFAFDADNPGSGAPLWQTSFLNPAGGVTTVPISEQGCKNTGFTEIGVMSTPVIDPATGTLYVTAKTREVSGSVVSHFFRLHALDITTGQEKFGGPAIISGSVLSSSGSTVTFTPLPQFQRPALLLSNGVLEIAFGSNGCDLNAQGWLFAYDSGATSGILQQLAIFNASPNTSFGASIWQSGNGPAADSAGNVFFATANGAFDFSTGGPDLGDSVLKINYSSGILSVGDYFTPDNQSVMAAKDLDLGSGGVLLLPTQPGSYPNLLVAGGKTGTIYLVDRDNLGQYNSGSNQNVQTLTGAVGPIYSSPVYWNNTVYYAANNDLIKGFGLSLNNLGWSALSTTPAITSASKVAVAGVPAISSNGLSNGILWVPLSPSSPYLAAYDATTLLQLYNSSQVSGRDTLGSVAHFVIPLPANGKVYVGTKTQLVAYGLFPFLSAAGGNRQSGTVGTPLPVLLSVQAFNSSGAGVAGVDVSFSDGSKGGTFNPQNAVTDNTGTATTAYTLPAKPQSLTITASASGYLQTSLTATAVAGPPTGIGPVSGQNQSGTAGTQLLNPIVVRLRDANNNNVPGLPVSFSDNGAGGSFSANPVTTGTNGQASVFYTLPPVAEKVTITASYSTLKVNVTEFSH
jgi:hypothetical protein